VRCAEEDVPRLDAAALLDLRTRLLRERPGDEQQVDADEGDSLPSVIKHSGANFARIVERAVISLAVAARLFHAEVRRDVALGETSLEDGPRGCGSRHIWRVGRGEMETEEENNGDGERRLHAGSLIMVERN